MWEGFAKHVLDNLQKLLKPKPELRVKRVLCDSNALPPRSLF